MDMRLEEPEDDALSEGELAYDALVQAHSVLSACLERPQPQWLDADLRAALKSVEEAIGECVHLEWVH